VTEMSRTGTSHVWLDLTHLDGGYLRERFPRIFETCRNYGIDLGRQPAPPLPARAGVQGL